MLRKQNSAFTTSFISEAGTKLENNDYFAYVEPEQYACYVIAEQLLFLPRAGQRICPFISKRGM